MQNKSKEKLKFKQYNLIDPIFRCHLTLYVGDLKQITQWLRKIGIEEEFLGNLDGLDARFFSSGTYNIMLLKDNKNIGSLIHELTHYAFSTMNKRGIPINSENDEVIAYYIEMMFKEIIKEIKSN